MLAKSSDNKVSNWGNISETKPSDRPANPNCMPMSVEEARQERSTNPMISEGEFRVEVY